LERWYVGHACELAGAGIDIVQLREEGRRNGPLLEHAAAEFWQAWLDDCVPGRS
jgi:GMP synthase (glutamine-hydrolysing)